MYDALPADTRSSHPFHMYDEIRLQPEAIARSLASVQKQGAEVAEDLGRARRIYVTGCGTSFHAAMCGARFLTSFSQGRIDARAVQAYEFVTYVPDMRPDDMLMAVSHSGTTAMTIRALEIANNVGATTALVTGVPESPAGRAARHVVASGYGEERSWAHTVSYTSALASMAALANLAASDEMRLDLAPWPELVSDVLRLEPVVHRMAGGTVIADARQPLSVVLVGAGPNVGTASEGALKLLETSYVRAIAFELEEILHGPLAAISPDMPVIVIAPYGKSTPRASGLCQALRELGVTPLVLCGEGNAETFADTHRLVLPDLPEVLSPVPFIVPLQLFSYFMSVDKGLNPDLIHRDDERQRVARSRYQ